MHFLHIKKDKHLIYNAYISSILLRLSRNVQEILFLLQCAIVYDRFLSTLRHAINNCETIDTDGTIAVITAVKFVKLVNAIF